MSNSFQMPHDPAKFRPPTPLASDGSNPFSEPSASGSATADPFASPAVDAGPTYKPNAYETTLPHRAGMVLTLGWLGVFLPILALSLLAIVAASWGLDYAVPASPVVICALAFSIPAWVFSSLDVRAIEAGAMHPQGRRGTVFGGWLGVAGTFLSLLFGLPAIVGALYFILIDIAASR